MITTWTLQNFKSVHDKTTLQLAPLTVFAGANSSGKSTILQSILLVVQTLQSPAGLHSLVLNGPLLRLGTFSDILSRNQRGRTINISFRLTPTKEYEVPSFSNALLFDTTSLLYTDFVECEFAVTSSRSNHQGDLSRSNPVLQRCSLSIIRDLDFPDGSLLTDTLSIRRRRTPLATPLADVPGSEQFLKRPDLSPFDFMLADRKLIDTILKLPEIPYGSELLGVQLFHFLPRSFAVAFDLTVDRAVTMVMEIVKPFLDNDFHFSHTLSYRYLDELGTTRESEAAVNSQVRRIILEILNDFAAKPDLSPRSVRALDQLREALAAPPEGESFIYDLWTLYYDLTYEEQFHLFNQIGDRYKDLATAARFGCPPDLSIRPISLPYPLNVASDYTAQFLSRLVKYLGPLRDEPRSVYPLAPSIDSRDVGVRGEHTASVLEAHRNTQIDYLPPYALAGALSRPVPAWQESGELFETTTLQDAVLHWLQYLGIAADIRTYDRGKLGHELKVAPSSSDATYDLTNVGVGVSQVLPILVLALLAEPGSTLLFEQPELHLHPRVQTRLADFFLSLAFSAKQCIVETHSEYIINRLRYLSAIANGDLVADEVAIYFVEKDQVNSTFRPVSINQFGVIEDWPSGFFDESEQLAAEILKAVMTKRKNGNQ